MLKGFEISYEKNKEGLDILNTQHIFKATICYGVMEKILQAIY